MEKILSVSRKFAEYIDIPCESSYILPEKVNGKIIFRMFTYMARTTEKDFIVDGISRILDYEEGLDVETTRVREFFDPSMIIKDLPERTLEEFAELSEEYSNALDEITDFVYKENLSFEEKEKFMRFKKIFNTLVVEDMKVLYRKCFPEFMKWFENII